MIDHDLMAQLEEVWHSPLLRKRVFPFDSLVPVRGFVTCVLSTVLNLSRLCWPDTTAVATLRLTKGLSREQQGPPAAPLTVSPRISVSCANGQPTSVI